MAVSQEPATEDIASGAKHIEVITSLVCGTNPRTKGLMPGWDLETARQKLLFFTRPVEFVANSQFLFPTLDHLLRMRDVGSVVFGWKNIDADSLQEVKLEDLAVNKGDNLFVAWAKELQKRPSATPMPPLPIIGLAGKTSAQFFNDYGLQAACCRKIGSLDGTTNPAIAVMGEDDLNGKGNIWGDEATAFIKNHPNKWNAVRSQIAKQQVEKGEADDWGATGFTEWVVVDAMLGLRSVFLLRGLGRVAFQLRPDWHDKEELLTRAGGQINHLLARRMGEFDNILLDGVGEPFVSAVGCRPGKSNNHFKIACTSQVALNVVRAFNAGHHPSYPGALAAEPKRIEVITSLVCRTHAGAKGFMPGSDLETALQKPFFFSQPAEHMLVGRYSHSRIPARCVEGITIAQVRTECTEIRYLPFIDPLWYTLGVRTSTDRAWLDSGGKMAKHSSGIDFGTLSGHVILVNVENDRRVATKVYYYYSGEDLPSLGEKSPRDWALQDPANCPKATHTLASAVLNRVSVCVEAHISFTRYRTVRMGDRSPLSPRHYPQPATRKEAHRC